MLCTIYDLGIQIKRLYPDKYSQKRLQMEFFEMLICEVLFSIYSNWVPRFKVLFLLSTKNIYLILSKGKIDFVGNPFL